MVRSTQSSGPVSRGAYVVRDTNPGDVLGASLKAAYDRDRPLPADMAQMLALLSNIQR